MSTNKLLQSLSEDPQLEKQIGCMAGILQLFDRHQVLTGRRLYGHKRISATGSKTLSATTNCGSLASDTSGTLNEIKVHTAAEKYSSVPPSLNCSPERQRSQPLSTPASIIDQKGSSDYVRASSLGMNDTSAQGSRDQLPKISFETARSSVLAPRRLDSSRSLHEPRINISHEGKVCPRRSVDTAERAAAAARGALRELTRISSDSAAPGHGDQVSIHDVVRASFGQEHQVPKSASNPLLNNSSRVADEPSIAAQKPSLSKDMSRAHYTEPRHSLECTPAARQMHTSASQPASAGRTAAHYEASRPLMQYKLKTEAPTRTCADISESLRLLAKLREAAPAYSTILGGELKADNAGNNKLQPGANQIPPGKSPHDLGKESFPPKLFLPRASDRGVPSRMSSYEPARASSVDALLQGGPIAKEIPRLSLDGKGAGFKADCDRGSHGKMHPRSLMTARSISCSNSDCDTESLHEKRTSFSSNVVAKLMGLDEMPSGDVSPADRLHPKLDLVVPSDQRTMKMPQTMVHDVNPTFSQCGKYVSASFFPSKRRDDIKIAIDPEEEEEESYLQMKPLNQQEARTINPKASHLRLQAGDRLVTAECANSLSNPCYQPKNHHFIEDRPPHVLSPAARLCAQIEEMQRADALHKEIDQGIRTMELQQSSKQDLEALKQLLGAIHLNKDYSHVEGSYHIDKFQTRSTTFTKHPPEMGQAWYNLHEQEVEQLPPLDVVWKTKRMLNDELEAHTQDNRRLVPMEGHSRRGKNGNSSAHTAVHDAVSLPPSTTTMPAYNSSTCSRVATRNVLSTNYLSTYDSPRNANDYSPAGSITSNSRSNSRTHTPPNYMSPRILSSPSTPSNQQLRRSSNSRYSWEGSSVSSTSSGMTRDQHVTVNRAANKQNKQNEKGVEKKRSAGGILEDRKESKANLISLRPSPTERRLNAGSALGTPRSNTRKAQKVNVQPSPDNIRSSMRSPMKSSARKAEEVKRKLNFSSPRANFKVSSDDQNAENVDKTMISSTKSKGLSKSHVLTHESSFSSSKKHGHEEMQDTIAGEVNFPLDTPPNVTHVKTEPGISSCSLPSTPMADGQGVESSDTLLTPPHLAELQIMRGDASPAKGQCNRPSRALNMSEQENEDTESQGDKSTGSCEQPSPISVLDGPFYEEDVSSPPPPPVFKLGDHLEEDVVTTNNGEASTMDSSLCLVECGSIRSDAPASVCESESLAADFQYVKQLLGIAGSPAANPIKNSTTTNWYLRPLEPHIFLELEGNYVETSSNAVSAGPAAHKGGLCKRRMIFNAVNASIQRRLCQWMLCQRQPWLLANKRGLHEIAGWSRAMQRCIVGVDEENNVCMTKEGGRVLLGEVWEEIMVQTKKGRKRKGKEEGEEEEVEEEEVVEEGGCDGVANLLEDDIMGSSEDWSALQVEKGELGLDLERLIFKDLIDNTIRNLGLFLHPPPPTPPSSSSSSATSAATKRQLFKLHH